MELQESKELRVVIVGGPDSGKTLTLNTLCQRSQAPAKTVGAEFCSHIIHQNGSAIRLIIWDCSGAKVFEKMSHMHLQRSDVALIFYGAFLDDGVEHMKHWLNQAESAGIKKQNIIVVRNNRKGRTEKNIEEGRKFCQKQGTIHRDIDASNRQQVLELFASLAGFETEKKQVKSEETLLASSKNDFDYSLDKSTIEKYLRVVKTEEKSITTSGQETGEAQPQATEDKELAGESSKIYSEIERLASIKMIKKRESIKKVNPASRLSSGHIMAIAASVVLGLIIYKKIESS